MEKSNRILEFENQFSSVELSLKLKELGASQETCFMWVLNKSNHPRAGWSLFANSLVSQKLSWEEKCAAYSCAELGKMLPDLCETYKNTPHSKYEWACSFKHKEDYIHIEDYNEANARAKILIYLIEKKLYAI